MDLMEIIHDEPEKQRFEVKDLDTANWAVSKVVDANARIAARKAQADEYKAKIDAWLDRANADDERTIEFFEAELRPFVQQEVARSNKKSVKLLEATAGFRDSGGSVEIEDEEALIAYLESFAPELVRVKKSVDKAELKKRLKAGEEFPHAHIAPGSTKFYVKEA